MKPETININARFFLKPCPHDPVGYSVYDRRQCDKLVFDNGDESECRDWIARTFTSRECASPLFRRRSLRRTDVLECPLCGSTNLTGGLKAPYHCSDCGALFDPSTKAQSEGRLLVTRFAEKWMPEPFSGCYLWTAHCGTRGYGRMRVAKKDYSAHRVSWLIHRGRIPKGMFVLHRCDTPSCVNPDHLFLGTHDDNMADAVKKGRHISVKGVPRGENHACAKLTESDVRAIRSASHGGRAIAQQFGVAKTTIDGIRQGRRWKHLL